MTAKTTTATKTNNAATTVGDLVKAALAIASASEKLNTLVSAWNKAEFSADDGQMFAAEYKLGYLKRFRNKSPEQATSATSSMLTTVRLSMHMAGKTVKVKKGKDIHVWMPSESLLKTRKLPTAPKPPANAPKPPANAPKPPANAPKPPANAPKPPAPSANISKDIALESLNKTITYLNTRTKKITIGNVTAIELLISIARAIDAEHKD